MPNTSKPVKTTYGEVTTWKYTREEVETALDEYLKNGSAAAAEKTGMSDMTVLRYAKQTGLYKPKKLACRDVVGHDRWTKRHEQLERQDNGFVEAMDDLMSEWASHYLSDTKSVDLGPQARSLPFSDGKKRKS